jgi:hypothetical protein
MTSKKINPAPLLEMGKIAYRHIRRVLRHSNELGPKNLSKTPKKVELKTAN